MARPKAKYTFEIDENGCFNCTSHKKGKWGHVITRYQGKSMGVYRHIYIECFGEIPEGLIVRHKCDNGSCINPYHLELGTDQDNKNDMVNRGRSRKGEKLHNLKVTEEVAYFIKNDTVFTAKELSEKFRINIRQVMKIRSGERWSHVETVLPLEEIKELRKERQYRDNNRWMK